MCNPLAECSFLKKHEKLFEEGSSLSWNFMLLFIRKKTRELHSFWGASWEEFSYDPRGALYWLGWIRAQLLKQVLKASLMSPWLICTLKEKKLTLKSCHRMQSTIILVSLIPPKEWVTTVKDFFPEKTWISEGYFMILSHSFSPYWFLN